MISDSQKIPKEKLEVEIELDDGRSMMGTVYISPRGRLTDMLNDERMFMPFETADGRFMALKKSALRSAAPLTDGKKAYEGNDPFEILGVSANASLDEIKQAYHRLCAENHPDRLGGMGLSQDYVELANVRMARINDAYRRIQKQFEDKAA
jgi:DnaJ-domain-containing protein 1